MKEGPGIARAFFCLARNTARLCFCLAGWDRYYMVMTQSPSELRDTVIDIT